MTSQKKKLLREYIDKLNWAKLQTFQKASTEYDTALLIFNSPRKQRLDLYPRETIYSTLGESIQADFTQDEGAEFVEDILYLEELRILGIKDSLFIKSTFLQDYDFDITTYREDRHCEYDVNSAYHIINLENYYLYTYDLFIEKVVPYRFVNLVEKLQLEKQLIEFFGIKEEMFVDDQLKYFNYSARSFLKDYLQKKVIENFPEYNLFEVQDFHDDLVHTLEERRIK